jgi:NADH dehydrogenase (ubiquinone) 1 subunit C2
MLDDITVTFQVILIMLILMFSGIQTHILTGIGGFLAGYYIDQYRNQYLAERDAVLRNYLERHPEDFPEPG